MVSPATVKDNNRGRPQTTKFKCGNASFMSK